MHAAGNFILQLHAFLRKALACKEHIQILMKFTLNLFKQPIHTMTVLIEAHGQCGLLQPARVHLFQELAVLLPKFFAQALVEPLFQGLCPDVFQAY